MDQTRFRFAEHTRIDAERVGVIDVLRAIEHEIGERLVGRRLPSGRREEARPAAYLYARIEWSDTLAGVGDVWSFGSSRVGYRVGASPRPTRSLLAGLGCTHTVPRWLRLNGERVDTSRRLGGQASTREPWRDVPESIDEVVGPLLRWWYSPRSLAWSRDHRRPGDELVELAAAAESVGCVRRGVQIYADEAERIALALVIARPDAEVLGAGAGILLGVELARAASPWSDGWIVEVDAALAAGRPGALWLAGVTRGDDDPRASKASPLMLHCLDVVGAADARLGPVHYPARARIQSRRRGGR